ncbi:MAG: HD domain-containing protein [Clostridia bacterium]|nr:HD domain-containing protein [Clostridia bacterium]
MSTTLISEEELENNKNTIINLLLSTNRPGMERLVKWLGDTDFFTAPASTKYHLACNGGLAQHSLNVYNLLKQKVESGLIDIPSDTVIITALLHDICKANFYSVQKRNRKIDGAWKEVEEWGVDDKLPLGHGDKSCYLVQCFIPLKSEEYAMIRYHMGRESDGSNDPFSKCAAKFPSLVALHTSDIESAFIVEARD